MFDFTFKAENMYPALTLAYIGDCVFELFVRSKMLTVSFEKPNKMHRRITKIVCAKTQSDIIHEIMDRLNDEELNVFKRGRNAKAGTVPKNADLVDYRRATGFETLVGYLHLKKEFDRLNEIMEIAFQSAEDKNQEE